MTSQISVGMSRFTDTDVPSCTRMDLLLVGTTLQRVGSKRRSRLTARASGKRAPRLPKPERRQHLLEVALDIVREEGADRLTLGHLSARAGVSKPVAYDHFRTRSDLLIELYRWIDVERVNAFRDSMASSRLRLAETADVLASTYIDCAASTTDEFFSVGAALAGSEEKAAVFEELLDNSVDMFVSVLGPHSALPQPDLRRYCIGLVGAGEALSKALLRKQCSKGEAAKSFATLIQCGLERSKD